MCKTLEISNIVGKCSSGLEKKDAAISISLEPDFATCTEEWTDFLVWYWRLWSIHVHTQCSIHLFLCILYCIFHHFCYKSQYAGVFLLCVGPRQDILRVLLFHQNFDTNHTPFLTQHFSLRVFTEFLALSEDRSKGKRERGKRGRRRTREEGDEGVQDVYQQILGNFKHNFHDVYRSVLEEKES